MNVPTIGQGPGSVATLPSPQTDNTQTSGETPVARGPAPSTAFARVAWFDLNGDGHIDNRNPLDGGDGTLIVPKHAAEVQTYSRTARRPELRVHDVAPQARSLDASPSTGGAASGAQTQRVIAAYQRYGQPTSVAPKDRAVA